MKNIGLVVPPNLGWLQIELDEKEINYLWELVKNKKDNTKHKLVGHIDSSYTIVDKGNWFFNNVIKYCIQTYSKHFEDLGKTVPISGIHTYYLDRLWVNFQKQNEFNPLHDHTGVYSFVIWLKIPTYYEEQNKNPLAANAKVKKISEFNFVYTDILGKINSYEYKMNPDIEGTMLFFPSELLHEVYPFYNCLDDRVSISGNVLLKPDFIQNKYIGR
tara:strand:+ start:165 stop:812 length:648 start_codon:yes stop_codon:yes gene_type:complete